MNDSEVLDTMKRSEANMAEDDYGYLLYGAVRSLITSQKFFKRAVYSYDTSSLTPEGERAVIELVNIVAPSILQAIKVADTQRAKELVLAELKKENP